MIKEHFHDLFTEGFGDIFYMKLYRFLNKKIKNEVVKKILINIHRVVYLCFLLMVAYLMFRLSFPL